MADTSGALAPRRFDWPLVVAVVLAAGTTGMLLNLYHDRELAEVAARLQGETDRRTSQNEREISELRGEVLALEGAIARLSGRVSDAFAARDLALRIGVLEGRLGLDQRPNQPAPTVPAPILPSLVPPSDR
jgi:hypothetical protein